VSSSAHPVSPCIVQRLCFCFCFLEGVAFFFFFFTFISVVLHSSLLSHTYLMRRRVMLTMNLFLSKGTPRAKSYTQYVRLFALLLKRAHAIRRLRVTPFFSTTGDFFIPAFQCPHLIERIGTLGDGGKWVCGMDRVERQKKCVIYSFGMLCSPPHMILLLM
jgi:hypothetical protein